MKSKGLIISVLIISVILFVVINIERILFLPRGEIVFGKDDVFRIEIAADGLEIPWEIEFLPASHGEDILVSERVGKISIFDRKWQRKGEISIVGAEHFGEGGLLGMVIHPEFDDNNWIYFYITSKNESKLLNRVERYTFENGLLDKKVVIIDGIPGAPFHDGGRMVFGPDGYLYIATGDATEEDSAQDIDSLSGKILRLTDQGEIPGENPFQNEVFSYGHRNPQGLSFDDEGNLWSSEHGRSGILSGLDEINIIVKGGNYGWPIIQGLEEKEGMIVPVLQSGGDVTWAPGDVIWVDDVLFYPGLRGEALYKVKVNENLKVTETEAHFFKEFGRLRTVVLGPDDDLYVTTSNRDGRGKVREGDDKVIRVKLNSL